MKHRLLPILLIFIVCLAGMAAVPANEPSGRPPKGPLERVEPKIYDITFQVTADTLMPRIATERKFYQMRDAPIVLPIIFQSTYSKVDQTSLSASLWLDGNEDKSVMQRTALDSGFPFHMHLAKFTVAQFNGQSLRWEMKFRTQVWASKIDNSVAAQLPWPREFPKEVADGLEPQPFIESNHEIFARAVEDASGGRLRLVPPYLAAKDLIRYCTQKIRKRESAVHHGFHKTLLGLRVKGALQAVNDGMGSPADIVCVCIATLRAAGIPARPVIGIKRQEGPNTFHVWGEFYLEGAGWVPFDPNAMQGKGIRTMDVRRPWPECGTMDDLNEWIPLSYHFIAPAQVESPLYPAVWGWDPRPGGDPGSEQVLQLMAISRGNGVEDEK